MNRVFKTFLLWLLIAALPLQGMAAAIKLSCGPAHPAMSAQGGVVEHVHHAGVAHDDGAVTATPTAHADHSPTPHEHKGSLCGGAVCCSGAAAPPMAPGLLHSFNSAETHFVSAAILPAGFIPDSLERPPRYISV
ncbi:hypothetical protein [Janthinobacterium sp.]|uniref:hypothetical protein n=1 Tax=Janthinobacterium sp. TaxID=1871054 RepID=UPI00293D8899|nr:hypothetical protein [Janthinobacterium sp.]